jgi:hypothetical protein
LQILSGFEPYQSLKSIHFVVSKFNMSVPSEPFDKKLPRILGELDCGSLILYPSISLWILSPASPSTFPVGDPDELSKASQRA